MAFQKMQRILKHAFLFPAGVGPAVEMGSSRMILMEVLKQKLLSYSGNVYSSVPLSSSWEWGLWFQDNVPIPKDQSQIHSAIHYNNIFQKHRSININIKNTHYQYLW